MKKLIRAKDAGVFYCDIEELDGDVAKIANARRIWYWEGAYSLSYLAQLGTTKPEACKFSVPVDKMIVFGVVEILDVTEEAQKIIESVKFWVK